MKREEYMAKRDWLRPNAPGMRARSVMRELRERERELVEQGTTVEAWLSTDRVRLGMTPWFVAYFTTVQRSRSQAVSGITTATAPP